MNRASVGASTYEVKAAGNLPGFLFVLVAFVRLVLVLGVFILFVKVFIIKDFVIFLVFVGTGVHDWGVGGLVGAAGAAAAAAGAPGWVG